MTEDSALGAITIPPLSSSALACDRRQALIALLAVPIALAAGTSSASEAAQYPLLEIKASRGLVYLLGHTPPRPKDWSDSRIEGLLRTCGNLKRIGVTPLVCGQGKQHLRWRGSECTMPDTGRDAMKSDASAPSFAVRMVGSSL